MPRVHFRFIRNGYKLLTIFYIVENMWNKTTRKTFPVYIEENFSTKNISDIKVKCLGSFMLEIYFHMDLKS